MNSVSRKPIHVAYIERENYENVMPLVSQLHEKGIVPVAVTTDGHPRVIRALQEVWPNTILQRCLFHIQNQGLMWLRTYPKTEAGKELRGLYTTIANIRTQHDMCIFRSCYINWHIRHKEFMYALPKNVVAFKDLKRAMALINNALPNMFHFIADKNIVSTTNMLESFFSRLKHHYRSHRGLSELHKISYLKWFCYYKSVKK